MQVNIKDYLPLFKPNIFFLSLFTMMSSMGASAFNHYFDVDIDSVMQRTKNRPMPSGKVVNSRGVLVVAILLFLSSILLAFKILNPMTGLHLFLGGFVYAVVYTVWLKRTHWSNIIIGGMAGS
ncbi:MAG: ctaB [Deltaproteobacteria bacterium]|nr:ctaB [Deltaproteobacteria bacterium]